MSKTMARAALVRACFFAVLWWLLAEGDLQAAWIGGIAVLAATTVSLAFMPPSHHLRLWPALAFLRFFLRNSIVSGLQVARLALDPRRGPAPRCVSVELTVPAGTPRLIVAGALGLMPGTLSVALDGAQLKVHALDSRITVAAEVAALEAHVAGMIGRQA